MMVIARTMPVPSDRGSRNLFQDVAVTSKALGCLDDIGCI